MALNVSPTVGFVAVIWSVIATGSLVYFWLRSSNLYSLLVEGANRFEDLRQRNQSLEAAQKTAEEKLAHHKDSQKRMQDAVDTAREKAGSLAKRLETKENEIRLVTDKLEAQKGHLERELQKLRIEYENVCLEKKDLSIKLADIEAKHQVQSTAAQSTFDEKLAAISNELNLSKKNFSKLEKKFKEVDPAEVRRVKRRIHDYERLYNSMKGLREMADERNRNWETALNKLSHWILTEGVKQKPEQVPEEIGPLVGMALQAVGSQLIDDNDIHLDEPVDTDMDQPVVSDILPADAESTPEV